MKNYRIVEQLIGCIEEEYEGYEIYIENNTDIYRGGFEWSVCKDNELRDSGSSFNIETGMVEAKNAIHRLTKGS